MKTNVSPNSSWLAVLMLWISMAAPAAPYYSGTFTSGFQNSGGIPDGSLNGWSDTRTVTGSGVHHVADVRVSLTLSGGYNGDLYAYLVHSNGMAVLLNRVGMASTNAFGYEDTGFNVTFSAAASHDIHFYQDHAPTLDGNGRLTGTWKPDARAIDPLSDPEDFEAAGSANFDAFANLDPHGEWTLFIADVSAGGGETTVVSWSLEIEAVVEPPISLVITSVNGGSNPVAGTAFSVEVEARDINDVASNVSADTAVELTLAAGNGTLAGTLTGTITAGTSSVTLSGVTYSRAESGVTLTASRTSGDSLTSDDSDAFTVDHGAFAKLQVLMPGETAAPGTVTGKTGSPDNQVVATSLSFTVRAVDAHWNLISTNDTVAISSSDTAAVLPANTALSGGSASLSLTFFTAGTQTITASNVTHGAIAPGTGASTTVLPGDQTITFASLSDRTYGIAPFALSATASSGLDVVFSVTSGPASLDGTTLTLTGAGEVTIQASQPGNANWNAATPVSRTFQVLPKDLVPAITIANKTYDGDAAATITGRSVSGKVGSDDVSLSGGTAAFTDFTVGSGRTAIGSGFTLTGAQAANYALNPTTATNTANITPATVTIASGLAANDKTYDTTTVATLSSNSVVLAGVVALDAGNVRLSTNSYSAAFDTAAVGTNKTVTVSGLTLAGSAAGNYSLTQPTLTASILPGTVTQLAFVVQPDGAAAGATFTQQPVVRTQDAYGNDSTVGLAASLGVTVALSSGTGTLVGTTTLDIGTGAGNGTVSFTNLRIDAAGVKRLTASATGLTSAESDPFTIANVAPVAGDASVTRAPNTAIKILISDILANASDANGDTLRLASVGVSTNGVTVRTNATYVLYSPARGNNVTDRFAYTVSDGTTTASGTIVVSMQGDPGGLTANLVSLTFQDGKPTVTFSGIPGYAYVVQRATDVNGTWTDLTTLVASAQGLFQYTDNNPPQGSAFYRAVHR